jgi:WD40 repeat protein
MAYVEDVSFGYDNLFYNAKDNQEPNSEPGSKENDWDTSTCQVDWQNPAASKLAHDPAVRKNVQRNKLKIFSAGSLGTLSNSSDVNISALKPCARPAGIENEKVEAVIYLSPSDESRDPKIITTTSHGHLGIRDLSKLDSGCSYFELSSTISAVCASRGNYHIPEATGTPEHMKAPCLFVATRASPTISAWNLETLEELAVFGDASGAGAYITSLCTLQHSAENCKEAGSPLQDTSHVLISGGTDQTVVVWDMVTATPVRTFAAAHTDEVTAVAAAFVGRDSPKPMVVSGGKDARIVVWDLRSGARLATLDGHTETVTALAIHQSSGIDCVAARAPPLLLSGSTDKSVIIWDLTSFLMVRKFDGRDSITSLTLHVPNEAALHRLVALAAANTAASVDPPSVDSGELATAADPADVAAEEGRQTTVDVMPEERPTESAFQQARARLAVQLAQGPGSIFGRLGNLTPFSVEADTAVADELKVVGKPEKTAATRAYRGAVRMWTGRRAKDPAPAMTITPPLDKSAGVSSGPSSPSTAPPTPSEHYGENPMRAAGSAKAARPVSAAPKSLGDAGRDRAAGVPTVSPPTAPAADPAAPSPSRSFHVRQAPRASTLPIPTGQHALLITHSAEKETATVWDLSTLALLRIVEEVDALCMVPAAPDRQPLVMAAIGDSVCDLWKRISGRPPINPVFRR